MQGDFRQGENKMSDAAMWEAATISPKCRILRFYRPESGETPSLRKNIHDFIVLVSRKCDLL